MNRDLAALVLLGVLSQGGITTTNGTNVILGFPRQKLLDARLSEAKTDLLERVLRRYESEGKVPLTLLLGHFVLTKRVHIHGGLFGRVRKILQETGWIAKETD